MVREWLHETAPQPQHPEALATTGYWKFTKHGIMQALRTGAGRDGLVREMDPDAVNRETGRSLAADDSVGSPNSHGRWYMLKSWFYLCYRTTKRRLYKLYTCISVRDGWMMRSSFVGRLTSLGERRVYAGHFCFRGGQLVRFVFCVSLLFRLTKPSANEPRPQNEDDAMMEDVIDDAEGWQGNPRRKLWKTACTRAALNVRSSSRHLNID